MRARNLLAIGVLICSCACTGQKQSPTTEAPPKEEKKQAATSTEEATDRLLMALNQGDYAQFSREFDDKMKAALNEAEFAKLRTNILEKIGLYQTRGLPRTLKLKDATVMVYRARFENEPEAEVRVVFREVGGQRRVSGLLFNSPKLRAAAAPAPAAETKTPAASPADAKKETKAEVPPEKKDEAKPGTPKASQ
ncbi:MAG TPA: DUF3887 domain-containing protein [Elusimicrobiota bacterium]|nr:DUF3887 domain-containing protein [Elusimicrobiota bacterium]